MKARITINGENVFVGDSKESARVALLNFAKTQNPLAKTASGIEVKEDGTIEKSKSGVRFFDSPSATADKLATMGDENAVIAFYELPEGKKEEKESARYNLHAFTARFRVAMVAETLVGQIFVDSTKKENGNKVEQEREL